MNESQQNGIQEKNTFDVYGAHFQYKVLKELIENEEFALMLFDIMKKDYFTTTSKQWLAENILGYIEKYKKCPTYSVLVANISEYETDPTYKEKIVSDLDTVKKVENSSDKKFVCEKATEFCRRQNMKEAIFSAVQILKTNSNDTIDKIRTLINDAAIAGTSPNLGLDLLEDIDYIFENTKRVTVPTGWGPIDEALGGGLGLGELGIIMAPANAGKTFLLCNIAAYNIMNGKNVVFYTMETTDISVGTRIAAYITDYEINALREDGDTKIKRHAKEILKEKITGSIKIKKYPAKIPTANTFYSHLNQLDIRGWKPDLIIIDYADLMKGFSGSSGAESYFFVKRLYEELKGLGDELKCRVWSATQVQVGAYDKDIITMDEASDGSSKSHTADIMLSFSRREIDKQQGTGRFYIAKARDVEAAVAFPAIVNLPKGKIIAQERDSNLAIRQSIRQNGIDDSVKDKLRAVLNKGKSNHGS